MAFPDPLSGEPVANLIDLQDVVLPKILSVAARILGLVVFVMLIVGGFQWLTASGDPKKIEQARSTLTGAVISILVIILGWFALNLINAIFFNPTGFFNLTIFDLCFTPNCT